MIVEKCDTNRLVPTKDSTRYFAIPEKEGTQSEGAMGFAFYSREDSSAFLKCLNDWHKAPPSPSICLQLQFLDSLISQEREDMVKKIGGSLPSRSATGIPLLPCVSFSSAYSLLTE